MNKKSIFEFVFENIKKSQYKLYDEGVDPEKSFSKTKIIKTSKAKTLIFNRDLNDFEDYWLIMLKEQTKESDGCDLGEVEMSLKLITKEDIEFMDVESYVIEGFDCIDNGYLLPIIRKIKKEVK